MREYLGIHEDVEKSLLKGKAVVALESTIISHGLPHPENLRMALEIEEIVRNAGATPATIAVLDGRLRVGLDREELEYLATARGIKKASVRDLPLMLAQKTPGATTVASTATIAAWAGIQLFVTGGIGGVHRGASATFDISADLTVLGRTPIAVVCAGAKSVLDIPGTLEYLETLGVTVVGYGTDRFPGFYVRETPHPVDGRVDTPEEAARVIRARLDLGLPGGVLVANPVPTEVALGRDLHDRILAEALEALDQERIRGKDVTPFLLARFKDASGGASLRANLGLIRSNAAVGAAIASALAELRGGAR